jgi:hypothetical protein
MKASSRFLNKLTLYGEQLSALVHIFDREFWERARKVVQAANPESDA